MNGTSKLHPADIAATSLSGRRVLVTGGLGFIGSNVVRRLATAGARVVVLDSESPHYGSNRFNLAGLESQTEVVRGDQCDEATSARALQGVEHIFNCVGQVSHVDSMEDPYRDLVTNVTAHVALLEACRKTSPRAKVVYLGTRGQYGRPVRSPVDESAPIEPVDVNGVNKHAGEMYHFYYQRVHGLRAVSLRLTNTYGPRHTMRTPRQGVLAWFVRQALDGETIQLWAGGQQVRDFNHVDDVVDAILLAMVSPAADGQTFNLGSPEPMSLERVARAVVAAAGSGSVLGTAYPEHLKRIEIGDYVGDYGKIAHALGWAPRVPLQRGLEETVAFYRAYRDRYWQPAASVGART